MGFSLLGLPPVYHPYRATESIVTHLQRINPGAEAVPAAYIPFGAPLCGGGLQGRVGPSYVLLGHLQRGFLPYFQSLLSRFYGFGVFVAQLPDGVERALIVVAGVQRVDTMHGPGRLLVGRGLA